VEISCLGMVIGGDNDEEDDEQGENDEYEVLYGGGGVCLAIGSLFIDAMAL